MVQKRDWLKGDIESLLLYLIFQRPMYGYQIIKELEGRSQGYFKFKEGTLYPVLHRLERAGLIWGQWQTLPGSRRRKYYHAETDEQFRADQPHKRNGAQRSACLGYLCRDDLAGKKHLQLSNGGTRPYGYQGQAQCLWQPA